MGVQEPARLTKREANEERMVVDKSGYTHLRRDCEFECKLLCQLLLSFGSDAMKNVGTLVDEVRSSRKRVLAAVDPLTSEEGAFKPAADQWCINEILEHLVMAEQSGITKMWLAAEGVRSGKPVWTGVHTNQGLSIEDIVARTWKAHEIAPPICTPMYGGPLAYWRKAFALCQLLLEALQPVLVGLDLEKVIYPHFISGPLDLGQRLEFLRFHMDRHYGQIERVKQMPGFYSAAR